MANILSFSISIAVIFLLPVYVSSSITGDYCDVIDEYESFKTSLENYLASKDEQCKGRPNRKDCASIKEEFPDAKDDVYRIRPDDGGPSFPAYCDMTQHGGGWLVIQRREDGSEDFYRTWFQYRDGFGNLTGEFWLGNEKIHRISSQGRYELRVDLENAAGSKFAEYGYFWVGNMSQFYMLNVSNYDTSSTAADHLSYNNNTRFSTHNLDLDTYSGANCAKGNNGAWWFKSCSNVHLNGVYTRSGVSGVWWNPKNYKKSVMKIRPARK